MSEKSRKKDPQEDAATVVADMVIAYRYFQAVCHLCGRVRRSAAEEKAHFTRSLVVCGWRPRKNRDSQWGLLCSDCATTTAKGRK